MSKNMASKIILLNEVLLLFSVICRVTVVGESLALMANLKYGNNYPSVIGHLGIWLGKKKQNNVFRKKD